MPVSQCVDVSLPQIHPRTRHYTHATTHTVPLELKSGSNKPSTSIKYKAQASLYSLLLHDKHNVPATIAFINYMHDKQMMGMARRLCVF